MFIDNRAACYDVVNTSIFNCKFINNSAAGQFLLARDTNVSVSHSVFTGNVAPSMVVVYGRGIVIIDHSIFTNISEQILHSQDTTAVTITHSEFVDNVVAAIVFINHYISPETLAITVNAFVVIVNLSDKT